LTWGITWRNKPQEDAVDAEIWSTIPEPVAQRNEDPVPPPPPVKKTEPLPKPEPAAVPLPLPASTKPSPADNAKIEADIAIDKKKKGANAKTITAVKAAASKGAAAKAVVDKAAADKAAADKAAHEHDELKRKEEPAKPTEEDTKLQQEKVREREAQKRRLRGLAQDDTGPTEKPSAAKASALSSTYLGRLRSRVRPNIVFSDSQLQAVKSNPEAEIEVTCNATGQILSKKLTRSSGNKAWDEAVLNAIEKTGKLPLDENGSMPSTLSFSFRPRD